MSSSLSPHISRVSTRSSLFMRPRASDFWLSAVRDRALLDQSTFSGTGLPCADVEEDISALENVLCLVKRNRNNRYPPVSRLSTELLVMIFTSVRDDNDRLVFHGRRYQEIGCIKITYTCHRWREVALGCPALWTNVIFPPIPQKLATEFLARSGTMPVFVDAFVEGTDGDEGRLANLLANCHSRIRNLKLSEREPLYHVPNYADVVSTLSKPMPILESAYLNICAGGSPFPPEMLSQAPRLTRLTIWDCRISWDMSIFSQLTEVKIVFNTDERPPITVADMNALFQRMACIKFLELSEMFPIDLTVVDGLPTPSSLVHLPISLSYFHMNVINSFVDALMFSISIVRAAHTRLMIDLSDRCGTTNGYEIISKVNHCLARHAGSEPSKTLSISLKKYSIISIGIRHILSATQVFGRCIPQDDVTVEWSLPPYELLGVLPSLNENGVPLREIVELSLDFVCGQSPNVWLALFQQATQIRRLRVTERTAVDLFCALADAIDPPLPPSPASDGSMADDDVAGTSETEPLSQLELLKIYITDDPIPDPWEEAGYQKALDYVPLMRCLYAWKQAGRPLGELQLPWEYEMESGVEKMRELVGVVTWNGSEWF